MLIDGSIAAVGDTDIWHHDWCGAKCCDSFMLLVVSAVMNLISSVIKVIWSLQMLFCFKTVFSLSWSLVLVLRVNVLVLILNVTIWFALLLSRCIFRELRLTTSVPVSSVIWYLRGWKGTYRLGASNDSPLLGLTASSVTAQGVDQLWNATVIWIILSQG